MTSALEAVSGQRDAPADLYPRERTPGTYCIGGRVSLRVGLDKETREKYFVSAGDRTPVV
jgi:hypothetical protein